MTQKTRRLVIAGLATLLAVASTGPKAHLYEDGSVGGSFCLPFQSCSGLVYHYVSAQTLNEGWVLGNCGYETRGTPGFFCLYPNE